MTPELYHRINEVVHSALELRPDERAAYLDEACGGDGEMRGRVDALIAAYEVSDEFLDAPAHGFESSTLLREPTDSLAGKSVGRYQILSIIGRGGMGTVYLAHDPRLDRK